MLRFLEIKLKNLFLKSIKMIYLFLASLQLKVFTLVILFPDGSYHYFQRALISRIRKSLDKSNDFNQKFYINFIHKIKVFENKDKKKLKFIPNFKGVKNIFLIFIFYKSKT